MNLSSGVSLGQLMLAIGVLLATSGTAWGSLLQRVRSLERGQDAMAGFAAALARIDERTLNTAADVREIKDSWLMKDPPGYVAISRQPGARK